VKQPAAGLWKGGGTPAFFRKSVIRGHFKSNEFVRVRSTGPTGAFFVRVSSKGVSKNCWHVERWKVGLQEVASDPSTPLRAGEWLVASGEQAERQKLGEQIWFLGHGCRATFVR
jgi:hypothetical protein